MKYTINYPIIILLLSILCFLLVKIKVEIVFTDIPPLFPLDDSSASYTVLKDEGGTYRIRYKKNNDFEQTAYVGSSQTDLENFVGSQVQVEGKFRQGLGNPLCYKICAYGEYSVIDIKRLRKVKEINSSAR